MCIVANNVEDTITAQGVLDKLNRHQIQQGKSNIKISLYVLNNYQRIYLEEIRSIFDQVRPMVSHIEVSLTKKPPMPKNFGEALGGPQRKLWKEDPLVQYEYNKI